MVNAETKKVETRLRHAAKRQGLKLEKSRMRDPRGLEFNTYQLRDALSGEIVECGQRGSYGLDLERISELLRCGKR